MKHTKTTLPNGVRIIVVPTRDNPSAAVMVACEAGSNYESKEENGLAHFLEHMLFKGTPSRPSAFSVSSELDSIGAESNAFTANEVTAYHAKSEKRHWQKLLEVVSDIYLNPSFPAADLEKERGVIVSEIDMYRDLPQRHVWDILGNLLYGDTPAGRTVLGPKENIKKFTRQDFLGYHRKHHVSSKTVVVVVGDVKNAEVVKEVKKIFGTLPKVSKRSKDKVKEKQSLPALLLERRKTDQTHMVMAFRAYPASDKRAVAASILLGILGDGMSSRLFQRLREQMGACYYVRTANDLYTDHGYVAISIGVDKSRAVEVTQALLDECKRLTYEEVQDKELQKTKDYMVSHMYMGLETTDALAAFYAVEEVTHAPAKEPQDWEKEARSVTAKDVMEVAKDIFKDGNLNLAVVGNITDEKKLKKVLTLK